jgi:hypothetical protein
MPGRGKAGLIVALCALLLCAVVAATGPSGAGAAGEPAFGCGHPHSGKAKVNPNPKGRPPLAIGDSTMLLPIPNLNEAGFSVNAKGCRGFRQSILVARALEKKGKLPHFVVINAYGNGGVNPDLIEMALDTIGPKRVLGLVTSYNADTGEAPAPDTGVIKKAAKRYPKQIVLMDWVRHSLPHHYIEPDPRAWFLPDLFHPNFEGAQGFADFIARYKPLAKEGRRPPLVKKK